MKRILLISVLISGKSFAQTKLPIDSSTGKIQYEEVVTVDSSVSANELFKRAKAWFFDTYGSGKDVVQYEDQETHMILGSGVTQAYARFLGFKNEWGLIKYKIEVACKDGRYRYTISNFIHEGTPGSPGFGLIESNKMPKGSFHLKIDYELILEQIDMEAQSLSKSLKDGMRKQISASKNW